ncbi:MAG TPA: hypothetical protein VGS19_23120 [Streptosporangiaceae bacterium]|nr:hypothetical protein [Streptosporangiaceae bacterium]
MADVTGAKRVKTNVTTWTYDAAGNTATQDGTGGKETLGWSDDGKLASREHRCFRRAVAAWQPPLAGRW